MIDASFPVMSAWGSAAVFGLAGLINLTAIRLVRAVYDRWDIPAYFYRPLGVVEIAAAALLATPDFRMWGIILAGSIMFGSIILLLDQRRYYYAAAAMLVMLSLVTATLAVPPLRSHVAYDSQVRAAPRTVAAEHRREAPVSLIQVSEEH